MSTTTAYPTNLSTWIAALNANGARPRWGLFDNVGSGVEEGVQAWSDKTDENGHSIGIWGNVVEDEDGERSVNWCIYVGDCVDPQESGLDSAEAAQQRAEWIFPEIGPDYTVALTKDLSEREKEMIANAGA